jgi:hypothetical protein
MQQVKGFGEMLVGRRWNALAFAAMLTLALAFWGTPQHGLAQGITASIVGTATDASGALLANATVTAENLDTELKLVTHTDSSGSFEITPLPIGHYRVTAELAGFKVLTVPQITLAEGDRPKLDLRMQVGQLQQSVQVSAETPALQTETSSLGTLFDKHSVEDLPLNGRNFMQLAQLSAGSNAGAANALASGNRPDDRRSSSNVTVNGQMSYSNNFLIDGLDDNERYIGTIILKPSVDALAEFKVSTNGYSAEFSRTSGGVIEMITKSGTDLFHGSLYEFLRNQDVDAKNFFVTSGPNPDYKQNQFGGSIGGPIKKGKTFFFGDYEGTRLLQGITYTSTVPTLAMRQGNFAGIANIFNPITRAPFPNNQIPTGMINATGQNLSTTSPTARTGRLLTTSSIRVSISSLGVLVLSLQDIRSMTPITFCHLSCRPLAISRLAAIRAISQAQLTCVRRMRPLATFSHSIPLSYCSRVSAMGGLPTIPSRQIMGTRRTASWGSPGRMLTPTVQASPRSV